jgi:uncharacterized protein YndB with AHSA1/START domain
MSNDTKRTLILSRSYLRSPEEVFDAWIKPDLARKWLFATPTGKLTRVELDARAHGKWKITRVDGDEIDHVGEYLVVDRPVRLEFTFGVPRYSDELTVVKITIVPTISGCHLTLTHQGVLAEWADQTKTGWDSLLNDLAQL